jgi:hypothetical protein
MFCGWHVALSHFEKKVAFKNAECFFQDNLSYSIPGTHIKQH